MKSKLFRLTKWASLVSIAIFIFGLGFYSIARAASYSGTIFGRSAFYGYFTNTQDGYGAYVLPVISGGQAIPSSYDTVGELITFLQNAYNAGGQRRVGALFIVNTMLGRQAPGDTSNFGGDLATIQAVLNERQAAGKINWTGNVDGGLRQINSYYQGTAGGVNPNDDAFYSDPTLGSEPGIKIINDDGTSYQLLRRCGNPVGVLSKIKSPLTIVGNNGCRPITITVKASRTYPRMTYDNTTYWGRIYLNIPAITSRVPIRVTVDGTYIGTYTFAVDTVITTTQSGVSLSKLFTDGNMHNVRQEETIEHVYDFDTDSDSWQDAASCGTHIKYIPDALGNPVPTTVLNTCWAVRYVDALYTHSTWNSQLTPQACYDYILSANMGDFGNRVEPGAVFDINPGVSSSSYTQVYNNAFWTAHQSGPHSKSRTTDWYMVEMVIGPGDSIPSNKSANNNSLVDPCTYFDPGGNSSCSTYGGQTVFSTSGGPSSNIGIDNFEVPDSPAGTKICFAFSVTTSASDIDSWSHSAFDQSDNCIIVVKKPKFQVWGGNLVTNGSISTSSSVKRIDNVRRMFGSWGEYGVFSAGTINGIASGSAFAPQLGATLYDPKCYYSTLTFTNSGSTTCTNTTTLGGYTNASSLVDVASGFSTTAAPNAPTGDLANLQGVYTTSGNLNVWASNVISKNRWVVINAGNSDVTITGNINYDTSTLYSTTEVPQVVIIARNINIDAGVTNVDAWLVASGVLNTCTGSGNLTIYTCSNKLTVNGPIVAGSLNLRRTAGSGTEENSGLPAEVFNLRADAYLWAYSMASRVNLVQTVYSLELPPRF